MANTKITALTEDATPADGDFVATVDVSDTTQSAQGSTKKVQAQNLVVKKLRTSTGPTVLTVGAVADNEFLKRSGTTVIGASPGGGGLGDVVGPGSSTDNAIARFDSTTGKLIQNSTVTLDDTGAMTFPEMAAPGTPASGNAVIYAKSDGLFYGKDDAGLETILSGGAGGGISGLTTSTIPKAASSTTIDDSQISQTATDIIVTSRDLKTRSVYSDTVSTLNYNLHSNNGLRLGSDVPGFGFTDAYIDNVGRHAGFLVPVSTSTGGGATFAYPARTYTQFTANQNNFDITENYFIRWSSDASRDITGMRNAISDPFSGRQADGEVHLIVNVGAQNIVLKNQDANSTDVNRFLNSTGADITLAAEQAADVIYDMTTARWRVYKRN